MKIVVALIVSVSLLPACYAEKNADMASVIAKRGASVFADDFEKDELSAVWSQVRGEWKAVNGEVVGKELTADKHAAVFHCLKKNRNSVVKFSFKLNGAEGFHFSLNHKKGHLFRAIVSADSLIVRTDADKRDKSIKSEVIGKAKGKFDQNKWYTMQVEMVGDKVAVTTDNGLKVVGQHPRLNTEKPNYRFILKGEYLVLDDLQVHAAE